MPDSLNTRLKHAWNAFNSRAPTSPQSNRWNVNASPMRLERPRLRLTSERSIIISLYTRIALDVASIPIMHVRTDQNGRFSEVIDSALNTCLTTEANIDQTGSALIQDLVMSMFDEGVVAVAPIETTGDPFLTKSYDIHSLRVGKIVEWRPREVCIHLYDDRKGIYQDLWFPKSIVAIIENPLYSVMNEPNGTLKRLVRKLAILDAIDEQSGAGKLDLIIQLPYVIKNETKRAEAEKRRKDIEMQLSGTKYGIAYTDGTERVTQLNRPAENNLMKQIEYLTSMLYSQLGITEDVFTGKADEATMLNYHNRTVGVIIKAIVDEFKRKYLTKTARSQNQSIMYFKDAFSLMPVSNIAEIADKFTRNEIMSSNEIRSIIGFKPSKDPKADELRNKNLNASDQMPPQEQPQLDANKLKGAQSQNV